MMLNYDLQQYIHRNCSNRLASKSVQSTKSSLSNPHSSAHYEEVENNRHGCLTIFLQSLTILYLLLIILVQLSRAYLFLLQPEIANTCYPDLPASSIQIYGFYSLGATILAILMLCMQKWAFYLYVLLSIFEACYATQVTPGSWFHVAQGSWFVTVCVVVLHAIVPTILFVLFWLSGRWKNMF